MKHRLFLFLGLAVLLWGGWSAAWAEPAEMPDEAAQVVENLLTLLDQGKFKESYSLASALVTEEITRDTWISKMTERAGMGELKSRKPAGVEKIDVFGDLPKGEYLKVVFDSEFSKVEKAQEIVVLHPGPDGSFSVAGYQILYNRWPEALKIMGNGLFLVFFIMSLLAFLTWLIGKIVQAAERKPKTPQEKG
ncbi:MAG: DUF4019 domain-containing protein [Pseudomonadota bacterium]